LKGSKLLGIFNENTILFYKKNLFLKFIGRNLYFCKFIF
jgi:hypothetical protein